MLYEEEQIKSDHILKQPMTDHRSGILFKSLLLTGIYDCMTIPNSISIAE